MNKNLQLIYLYINSFILYFLGDFEIVLGLNNFGRYFFLPNILLESLETYNLYASFSLLSFFFLISLKEEFALYIFFLLFLEVIKLDLL